ncbi:HTH-type transcriptional regulator BenM [Sulfitobacter sp. THAF37]|uniref:pca operon transcription factor PcaQ n=1 Tax=Sulfitobacter sp. THAF37 TaxID=2587855 RepID=UPI001268831B|nr:pca operon transcription factor PcaQ [Sulfitobacter sp. THAF37]QFT58249.1 HTH-type transcriptional regulator BenM [Sulfitobacter sp. THAF37]
MELNRTRQIKMRHLAAFVETVRCGSLKAAAERMFLTQSTLSKTLADLENILGTTLMHRGRGGISLTREGAVFRQFAEQGLAAVSHGLTSLDALSAGRAAPLRIGTLPSVSADLLPDVILRFETLAPSTPVTVVEGPVTTLTDGLRAADFDLVIGRMGPTDRMTGLNFTHLYSERVIFAAATGHPAAEINDAGALAAYRVLYPPPNAAIRPLVDRFMIERGIGIFPRYIETVSTAFARAMTLGSAQAVWIISQGVVARDIAAGRMTALPIETDSMSGPVGIMTRSEEDPAPALRLFRQALFETTTDTREGAKTPASRAFTTP